MLNPNHLAKLRESLQMIIGPHSVYKNRSLASLVREGEQTLALLRTQDSYPYLLSHYLVELQSRQLKLSPQIKAKSKTFILVELKNVAPITNRNSWWHLLEFYFSCDEKAEALVIDLLILHFKATDINLSDSYRPFLERAHDWARGGMFRVAKVLALTYALTSQLELIGHQTGYSTQWKIRHIQFMASFLNELLRQVKQTMPNYCQTIAVCTMQLVAIGHELAGADQHSGQYTFRYNTISNLEGILRDLPNLPILLRLLLFLCSASIKSERFSNYNEGQQIAAVLGGLLRARTKKNNYTIFSLKILNYFLTNFEQNAGQLRKNAENILEVYAEYVTQVEVHNHASIILPSFSTEAESNQELQGDHKCAEASHDLRFKLLNWCLHPDLLRKMLRKSEIQAVAFLAYATVPIEAETQTQVLMVVVAYIKSAVHHSESRSIPTIICCIRYLYMHIMGDPNYDLVSICTAVINLRLSCPQVQELCDVLLCRGAGIIATTIKGSELWQFANIWKASLMQNYMDTNALSFYPLLLLLDSCDDHCYIDYTESESPSLNFDIFFLQILELLFDQGKNSSSQGPWCSNFEIFYKWCAVFIRYLLANGISSSFNTKELAEWGSSRRHVIKIINKSISYIFQNQLYCADTAYLYVMKLVWDGPNEGLLDFVNNLMTPPFWRGLDQAQVFFYACVLMGIVRGFAELFPPAQVYPSFTQLMCQIVQAPQFSDHSLDRLVAEMTVFLTYFNSQSYVDEGFFLQQISNQKQSRMKSAEH